MHLESRYLAPGDHYASTLDLLEMDMSHQFDGPPIPAAHSPSRRSLISGGIGLTALALPAAAAATSTATEDTEPAPTTPSTTTTTAPLGLMTWTERTHPNPTASFHSVTYGDGAYVAVAALLGDGNRVIRSTNGTSWAKIDVSVAGYSHNDWRSVTYGDGTFVAVSSNGVSVAGVGHIMRSTDNGETWSRVVAPENRQWWSVAYGEPSGVKTFVATAVSGTGKRVITSTDKGASWTAASPPDHEWVSVTYGNGTFVAVSTDGKAMTSPDGISWTLRTVPNSLWRSVTFGGGTFVAVSDYPDGDAPLVMTSTDSGATWTARTAARQYNYSAVTYGGGLFVAVARYGGNSSGFPDRVMTSPDGITWTRQNTPVEATWRGVTHGTPAGSGLFVAVGGGSIMTSPHGS